MSLPYTLSLYCEKTSETLLKQTKLRSTCLIGLKFVAYNKFKPVNTSINGAKFENSIYKASD